MKACVLIDVADDGKVSVGTYQGDLPPEMSQNMQPVASVDDALTAAKQMLEQGDEEQGETAPDNEAAEGNFQAGFKKAQPAGPTPQGY